MTSTLALDLEGTLISNAMSCFPRPGLHEFLEAQAAHFDRLVLFTAVSGPRVRKIAHVLAGEGSAPAWFAQIEIIDWQGETKDLRLIAGADVTRTLLVDDIEAYVHAGQHDQWVAIAPFEAPYPATDRELERIGRVLAGRALAWASPARS